MVDGKQQARLQRFCHRVAQREAVVGVMGLGYVGLPLAMEFIRAGFQVVGVDRDPDRIGQLREGNSFLPEIPSARIKAAVEKQQLFITDEPNSLVLADAVIICVPTPLTDRREPDLSFVEDAVQILRGVLAPGSLVVLESTTYPGTTEEVIQPVLEAEGFRVGEDLFLCYSPERVDPANSIWHTRNTPKILAGCTGACQKAGFTLYTAALEKVIPVSSTRTAEMVKLLENTFRSVNIALANEMAILSAGLGIDVWEVIAAASTKPFGFMPFYPGPGTGGHCIPLDPLYLQWKARGQGLQSRLIELAAEVNEAMPDYVASQVVELLEAQGNSAGTASVLLLGMAYKRDVGDIRESPSVRILELLQERGCLVSYHDPLVSEHRDVRGKTLRSVALTLSQLQQADCVVLTTDHSTYDYQWIAANARLILDTRNGFHRIRLPSVQRLGAPPGAPGAFREALLAADWPRAMTTKGAG